MQNRSTLLVFPTSRAIREYVHRQKEHNTLLPKLLTIDEFFKKSLYFENAKLIDEDERFLYLKEAVQSINLDALGIDKSFSTFMKQSDYLYRFFLELSSENVQIESLLQYDTYGYYTEHLRILQNIHSNYIKILERNNSVDKVNRTSFYQINEEFIQRYNQIELFFEGYFTSFEFEVIKKIASISTLKISFIYNTFNKKSIEKFVDFGFDLQINHSYCIDFSNKKICEAQKLMKKNHLIEVKAFASRTHQIAFIKKSITKLIEQGINPEKIAVILPDEQFAVSLRLFDTEGYFNYAMGLDIKNSTTYVFLHAIYEYIQESEIKQNDKLVYLSLNQEKINTLFKENWNKTLTQETFENFVEFIFSHEKNQEIVDKLKEIVYKFYKLIFSLEEKITLKDAYKIFMQRVSALSLDDINSGKITVMGLLESRHIQFEAILIPDFNESFIPKRSTKDKFLSTALKEMVGLPTALDRENLQKYYYEKLIRSTPYVFISYTKNANEQLSRFANTLFSLEEEKTHDSSYKQILYSNHELKHFNDSIVLDVDLSTQTWSASSLKTFLECKRKYYYNHILKLKEHDTSLKPKPYEIGNIVHRVVELYKKANRRGEKVLDELLHKEISHNPFLNMDIAIWKRKLLAFVEIEKQKEQAGFILIGTEKPFLITHKSIKLSGKIDRIDKQNDTFYVMDYKTSSNLKIDTKRTYENSCDFQLEFYFLAVQDTYQTSNIEVSYYDLFDMEQKEETALEEKLLRLDTILESLHTTTVSFDTCENTQTCQFCTYKTLCDK